MFRLFLGTRERLRREASDWLARMQGPAGEADRAAFQRWYDADPAHAEAFDRVRARYGGTGMLAATELAKARGLPVRAPASSRPSAYALAAGVAALLLISGAVLVGGPGLLAPPAEAEALFFATNVGEIRQVPLPDGTQMTLDTRTAVKVEMDRDMRHVTLREGRARFAVAARDKRPFVVEAGGTRVIGRETTFDVAFHRGVATVRPLQGTISVQPASSGAGTAPSSLAPGQAILVSSGGERMQSGPPSRSEALWPSGMLEFDNMPLDRAIAEANRYSEGRISLAEPSLFGLRVSGTFRAGDLEGLARSLEAAFGLRLERAGGGRLILHPGRAAVDR